MELLNFPGFWLLLLDMNGNSLKRPLECVPDKMFFEVNVPSNDVRLKMSSVYEMSF
jgi:hypothetical protein